MRLGDLLKKCLFVDDVFSRIDIPIRYMAVELWDKEKKIHDLWWRMQFVKLLIWKAKNKIDNNEFQKHIDLQKNRLIWLCTDIQNHKEIENPIIIGSNYLLKDGSHRIACFMYYNMNDVNVKISDIPFQYSQGTDNLMIQLYTDLEKTEIFKYKDRLLMDLENGRWN